jgi:hypothetical protein
MGHGAARLDLCNVPCRHAGPYGRRDLHSAARDVGAVPKVGKKLTRAVGQQMQGFRAYIMGPDGHVIHRVDLRCTDEQDAKRQAKRLVDGRAVELWDRDRKITRFEPNPGSPPSGG